jgi:hypothetical protein
MDKPNSCVVANTQIKPGISRQVRAMRKLEYVRFISLSPGGGPNSREIIMNDRLTELGVGASVPAGRGQQPYASYRSGDGQN